MIATLIEWWPWAAALGGAGAAIWLFPVLLLDKRAWIALAVVALALYTRHSGIKTERARVGAVVDKLNAREAAHTAAANLAIAANKKTEADGILATEKLNKEHEIEIAEIRNTASKKIADLARQLIARERLLHAAAAGSCATATAEADPGSAEKAAAERPVEGAGGLAAAAIGRLKTVTTEFAETVEVLRVCREHVGVLE